jgi:hypothetical protein
LSYNLDNHRLLWLWGQSTQIGRDDDTWPSASGGWQSNTGTGTQRVGSDGEGIDSSTHVWAVGGMEKLAFWETRTKMNCYRLQHLVVAKIDNANRLKTPAEQVTRYTHHSIYVKAHQKKSE